MNKIIMTRSTAKTTPHRMLVLGVMLEQKFTPWKTWKNTTCTL
jgi:hypothetical protein